jgi:hypothetical protein
MQPGGKQMIYPVEADERVARLVELVLTVEDDRLERDQAIGSTEGWREVVALAAELVAEPAKKREP